MAKIKLSDSLKKLLTKKPQELARKALLNPKLANRIKNKLLLPIKKSGTLPSGKSVKALSEAWIRRRGRLAQVNKTSTFYSQRSSNLTFTGSFLNSFKAIVVDKINKLGSTKVVFSAFPSGEHISYKNIKKGKSKSVSNEDLGKYLIDNGRDYTVISEQNKKQIAKSLKSAILKEFKLNLKRK